MDDLKPLLVQLLDKVDAMQTDLARIKTDVADLKTARHQFDSSYQNSKDTDWPFEDTEETRTILEIARLGGRIDQLSMQIGLASKTVGS